MKLFQFNFERMKIYIFVLYIICFGYILIHYSTQFFIIIIIIKMKKGVELCRIYNI